MTDTVLTKGAGGDVADLETGDLFGETAPKPAKKKAAKKPAAKKPAAKKKPATKKPAAKKAPAKKVPVKKAAAKKAPAQKAAAKTTKAKTAKVAPGAVKKGKAISTKAKTPAPKAQPKPKVAEPSAIPLSKAAPSDQDLIADAAPQAKVAPKAAPAPEPKPAPAPEPVTAPEPVAKAPAEAPTSKPEDGSHWDGSEALAPSRALTLSDFAPPSSGPVERMIRLAYRIGIPGPTLTSPFRKPAKTRILATVDALPLGRRAAGMALRAGHFLIHGVKAPIAEMDFAPAQGRLTPPFERVVHGFSWMRDLAASAPREQCAATAERITQSWLDANPKPNKSDAWKVEHVGARVLAWLMHAPMLMSRDDSEWRGRMLAAIEANARWLDHHAPHENDRLAEIAGWAGVTAAGLLLPEGKPRRLFGEAGLLKALGDLVAEDGGVLSRSPMAQMDAIALLVDLRSCYEAVEIEMPSALGVMLELLVPPLLALRHGDGGLGSWQGAAATGAEELATLIEASGVRTRPLKDIRQWGFQRLTGGKTIVQFDAAPPPRARYAKFGCASTLAFEMSDGSHRLIVNCGGAAVAGGQVPARIEQGLRASAAHSTLVLDNVNSTSVLIKGKLGKGVELVEIDKRL
ncbi:MAG: heparinase II/III family protein, partial [Marinomonas sp.]